MSNVNNQFKELVNEAIHNHFHDKTETEMILKDWLYGICEQLDEYEAMAKVFDEVIYAINSSSNPGLNGSSYIDAADFTIKVEYILRKYESGEYDA